MAFEYPLDLIESDGRVIAAFPGVEGARTSGFDEQHARLRAGRALVCALAAYVARRRNLPRPGGGRPGSIRVSVPAAIEAKLAVYQTMRDEGVSLTELARRLGCDRQQAGRVIDLTAYTPAPLLEKALEVLQPVPPALPVAS
jgi:antitoxin HicB